MVWSTVNQVPTTKQELLEMQEKKAHEATLLADNFNKEEILYIRNQGYLDWLKSRLQRYESEGKIEQISTVTRQIQQAESKAKELLYVLRNPEVDKYLDLRKEIETLKEEYTDICKKELDEKKTEYTKNFYAPLVDKLSKAIDRAYQELGEVSKEKEHLKQTYGMSEKGVLETLSREDREAINKVEDKINTLEQIKKDMSQKYDFIIATENDFDFSTAVASIKEYITKTKNQYLSREDYTAINLHTFLSFFGKKKE